MEWHQNRIAGILANQPEVSRKKPSNSRFLDFFHLSRKLFMILTTFSTPY